MSTTIPAGRIQLRQRAPRQYAAMLRLAQSVGLDHGLANLLHVRASQLNGCAFCLDMHWKDARAAGEGEDRLYMLSGLAREPAVLVGRAPTSTKSSSASWCSRSR